MSDFCFSVVAIESHRNDSIIELCLVHDSYCFFRISFAGKAYNSISSWFSSVIQCNFSISYSTEIFESFSELAVSHAVRQVTNVDSFALLGSIISTIISILTSSLDAQRSWPATSYPFAFSSSTLSLPTSSSLSTTTICIFILFIVRPKHLSKVPLWYKSIFHPTYCCLVLLWPSRRHLQSYTQQYYAPKSAQQRTPTRNYYPHPLDLPRSSSKISALITSPACLIWSFNILQFVSYDKFLIKSFAFPLPLPPPMPGDWPIDLGQKLLISTSSALDRLGPIPATTATPTTLLSAVLSSFTTRAVIHLRKLLVLIH